MLNLNYHDIYWQSDKYGIPRMDPAAFLKTVYAAMKPGAVIGVIDHVASPNSDTRATVEKLHRIDPEVIKADFKRAGFVLVGTQQHPAQSGGRSQPAGVRPENPRQDRPRRSSSSGSRVDRKRRARQRRDFPRLLGAGRAASPASRSARSRWGAGGARAGALEVAGFVGTLWLNALKMTVIPLVVALLVVGIARSAEAALGGRIAGRSVLWIVIMCTASAMFGAVMILLLSRMRSRCREGPRKGCRARSPGSSRKRPGPCPASLTSSKA